MLFIWLDVDDVEETAFLNHWNNSVIITYVFQDRWSFRTLLLLNWPADVFYVNHFFLLFFLSHMEAIKYKFNTLNKLQLLCLLCFSWNNKGIDLIEENWRRWIKNGCHFYIFNAKFNKQKPLVQKSAITWFFLFKICSGSVERQKNNCW